MQPYALFRDSRDDTTWRVAADGQSKVPTGDQALSVDIWNLTENGWDPTVFEADNTLIHAWLDSVPG